MGRHVIVGAGTNGQELAELLASRGEEVLLLSRRGTTCQAEGVSALAIDASNAESLAQVAQGASAIYNVANPPYHRWTEDWPPLSQALIEAAEQSGAVLVTLSNLYGYGPVDEPMSEATPLAAMSVKGQVRAKMWRDALAAHEADRIRCTELRASDFYGPRLTDQGYLGERAVPRVLSGKGVQVIGNPDLAHSWTYVPDVVAALATAASDERAWGKAWHVPTAPARSAREMVGALANAAGVATPRVSGLPNWLLSMLGVFSPTMRELKEISYQFNAPFILDSSAYTECFGQQPTPTAEGCAATVAWWRERLSRDS